ncbi:nucleoside phosphorylase domain-containing protein [Fusarium oxysporum]|nr:nucleoside phosphorylase domain-containing protein [Fusarium oxysporum]
MRTRLKSPDLYTIGWIAALPMERAAVTALLHDRHDAPEGFKQHQSDANSYTWGRIGEHNIVIASLSAGVYGVPSAAHTASALIHSLPHIRIGLLVGIGGGGGIARPDLGRDIRLGDVVVSQPDGATGGVVQYDFGKAKVNGVWERKGSLDKPPPVLLNALAGLQAEHEITPSKIPDLLQAMLKANPRMKLPETDYTYQGIKNDRLFESYHVHVGGSNCDKCDPFWEIERHKRDSTDPKIHYGTIASGNTLIKDAATRDSLLDIIGQPCLCVEIEAAGLMDRFPCLVIRGICDYADSHKNDRWQRYASATAAAFAVELLEFVPARQLEVTKKIIEVMQSLEEKVNTINASIQDVNHSIALRHLPIAEGASFDSRDEQHNPKCLQNTRVELLKNICYWIDDPDSKTIFWLNGMAGTGKSTIARTVAQLRSGYGDLGASFFFKRGEPDRGSLARVVPTLARQLAGNIPGVASVIKKAVDADPAIVGKTLREQFDKLIREPLLKTVETAATPSSLVIVIDALDECERDADIRLLINVLSQTKLPRPRVRFFLTSRPELPIRLGFGEVKGAYQDLLLHEMPTQIVEHDISAFLASEFRKIRDRFNITVGDERKLPSDWPGQKTLQDLTSMAVPLFIFAATVCRFIDNRKRGNPQKQLHDFLKQGHRSHGSQLDQTYGPILRSQITDVSKDDREQIIENFKDIIGSIVILATPLSVTALSQLLGVSPDVVDDRLDALHSILSIPPTRQMPVRLLHLSFREYLISPKQKETSEFWVDEKLAYRNLTKHCLRLMRGTLRENICGLPFPGIRRSAVGNARLEKCIPSQL